jgi:uncharacterized protein (TIGR02588 family)
MAQPKKKTGTPLLEWVASGIGLLLTLSVLAVIGREALSHEAEQLPAIEVGIRRIAPAGSGFVVEIEAANRSGGTAAAVEIEGALKSGGTPVETSSALLDYVPAHSRRTGGLFFTRDPRLHQIEVRALGYQTP